MDYPDPDEEFEMMHAQELEMMREMEDDFEPPDTRFPAPKSRKSLDFGVGINGHAANSKKPNCISDVNTTNGICEDKENVPSTSVITSSEGVQPLDSNHKRTVQDLFGDIDDIDFDSLRDPKKARVDSELSEIERQMAMIDKILKMRKEMNEIKMQPTLIAGVGREKRLEDCMTRNVPKWAFMPVSDSTGRRVYLRLHSEDYIDKEIKKIATVTKKGDLLGVPYSSLYKIATAENHKKIKAAEDKMKNERTRMDIEIVAGNGDSPCGDLWVEKYKPKNYLELLSDEGTNRLLLQWLKLWDKLVFNREKRVRAKDKEAGGEGTDTSNSIANNSKFSRYPHLTDELDEFHRPRQYKVALLCGPPGLGKTTLAHMIARQAGYNVVEVNASDDRSPDVFRTQLESATQMRAVMGTERRPNCLVLDEIDGAPLASIEVVVKFASDKGIGKGTKGKQKAGVGATDRGAKGLLRRPIICICNDVYVPALRPLRQIAFTLHFPPTSTSRLAERLMDVCCLEYIRSDLGAMMALAEKSGNDIRACLQALQCLQAAGDPKGTRKVKDEEVKVNLLQVQKVRLGAKDSRLGLFAVWQKIFHRVDMQPSHTSDVDSVTSPKSHISGVVRAVQNCGEYERLVQGVHENFLSVKSRDLGMSSVSSGLNWFCFFDQVFTTIQSTQDYVLYPYLPYAFGAWHILFSSRAWPKLTYPSVGYEMFQRGVRTRQQLDFALRGMQPPVRCCSHRDQLVVDTVPYLLELLVPDIRPVSSQLYTPKERHELYKVVAAMIDYNVNYTQERTQDGSFVYNMDPNLEEVGRFKGSEAGRRTVGYAGRQMLSREVEAERLRRTEAMLYKNASEQKNPPEEKNKTAGEKKNSVVKNDNAKKTPNFMQKLTPKALKKKTSMEARDFFGRIVESNLSAIQAKAKMDDIVKSSVWFHFKEGYNNAVRRNILMDDLY